ncbi:MAG TPA: CDP-alcohol phosphatidyltransferase family protein [Thermoplasmata archaeon]|nr:CDP-alcohol phosphatidyltransferase family protein [Thermoplasmata archaeon]
MTPPVVAEGYRARVQPYVRRLSEPFLTWAPARLSGVALGLAAAAAALSALSRWLGPLLFLAVALLIFFSGVFDVIDGEVARRTGRSSRRGDLLDHVFDRYADVALLLGIAVSSYSIPVLALLALVSLLLTSYMGTQAQALGAPRLYAGLLSRADRLLILALVTFLEFDLSLPWPWAPTAPFSRFVLGGVGFTVIDAALVYFVIAGQVTAVARARTVYRSLPPGPDPPAPNPP